MPGKYRRTPEKRRAICPRIICYGAATAPHLVKIMDRSSTRRRPTDLKRSLLLRIAIVAAACFALVTIVVVVGINREGRGRSALAADQIARQLEFQLLRINAGFDLSNRFPDWDSLLNARSFDGGQCVRYENSKGEIVRSDCVGTESSVDAVPEWFRSLSRLFLAPEGEIGRDVSYMGTRYGRVIVTEVPDAVAARIWRDIKLPFLLTLLTIVALSFSVYAAISRALAPTKDVIAGLNRLSAGDFSHRLPNFSLAELQRISDVVNELAAKIENMLAQHSELSKRLVNAQEDERRHLARDLHDEFGQNLTAIAAIAASIEQTADETCPELCPEARSLSRIAAEMIASLRDTLLRLRPADFDKIGFAENLRQLVDVWSAGQRRRTHFELDIPPEIPLPGNAAIHLFRIAQEGLTNAVKHADASSVRLSVVPIALPQTRSPDATGIRLTIEDDGGGLEAREMAQTTGRGLINMCERVAALGGTIAFEDRPGAGLKVQVVVPVIPEEKADDGSLRH